MGTARYSYISAVEAEILRLEVRKQLPCTDHEVVKKVVFMKVADLAEELGTDTASARVIRAEIRRYVWEQWKFQESK